MKHLRVVLPMALAIGMFLGIANFVYGDTSGFTSCGGGITITSDSLVGIGRYVQPPQITFTSPIGALVIMDYADTLRITSELPVDSTAAVILSQLEKMAVLKYHFHGARADSMYQDLLLRALEFIPEPWDAYRPWALTPLTHQLELSPVQKLRNRAKELRREASKLERRDRLYRDIRGSLRGQ